MAFLFDQNGGGGLITGMRTVIPSNALEVASLLQTVLGREPAPLPAVIAGLASGGQLKTIQVFDPATGSVEDELTALSEDITGLGAQAVDFAQRSKVANNGRDLSVADSVMILRKLRDAIEGAHYTDEEREKALTEAGFVVLDSAAPAPTSAPPEGDVEEG